MGCDIHMYVEYRSTDASHAKDGFRSFGSRINPGRSYDMFGQLAGVRSDFAPKYPRVVFPTILVAILKMIAECLS